MSWRSILIENPAKLTLKDNQLRIKQEENEYSIPIEDIANIMIDNTQVSLTNKLLSKLAKNNIALYICDESHLPTGIYTALNQHSRQLKILERQFYLPKPFKKRCWQAIIQKKILNQARCLELAGKEGVERLRSLISRVNSGDTENIESLSSRLYYSYLWGKSFKRFRYDTINMALNYGYSIIRGTISRSLVIYGFYPAIGIHHHSELNNFNLADDFIEPLRSLVDLWVVKNCDSMSDFNTGVKAALCNILYNEIGIDGRKHNVINGINIMIRSFSTSLSMEDYTKLLLPDLLELKYHSYE